MENRKLDELKRRLNEYYDAESKILRGQSYMIGSQRLTRADLSVVAAKIKELESEIETLESRGSRKRRTVRAVPLG